MRQDQDRQDQWVIAELSHRGEQKGPAELKTLLKESLPDDIRIFIPSVTYEKGEHSVTIWLLEGYVFIQAGLRMARYFCLEGTAYVSAIMTVDEAEKRRIRYVDGDQVSNMQDALRREASRDIEEGDEVLVCEGTYAQMTGVVTSFNEGDKEASVVIRGMRSREPEVELPVVFLEKQ